MIGNKDLEMQMINMRIKRIRNGLYHTSRRGRRTRSQEEMEAEPAAVQGCDDGSKGGEWWW